MRQGVALCRCPSVVAMVVLATTPVGHHVVLSPVRSVGRTARSPTSRMRRWSSLSVPLLRTACLSPLVGFLALLWAVCLCPLAGCVPPVGAQGAPALLRAGCVCDRRGRGGRRFRGRPWGNKASCGLEPYGDI